MLSSLSPICPSTPVTMSFMYVFISCISMEEKYILLSWISVNGNISIHQLYTFTNVDNQKCRGSEINVGRRNI